MRYFLESAGLWDYTFADEANFKPKAIAPRNKDLEDHDKLERQQKCADKIIAWPKNNVKCKDYIGCMCLGHIKQKFQAVKTDWVTHEHWKWLKKRYNFQNTISKWAIIVSVNKLTYATRKNIAEYCSKYYIIRATIQEKNISIKDELKIRMLNNLGPAFKTYFIIVNN